jgi:SAM-dependent methyltransferase
LTGAPQAKDPEDRAGSFGEVASSYDRFRPSPPRDAVEWLLPEDCRAVLDVGAGTGGLTRSLVGRVPHVVAVEPDPRMRRVLATRTPGAEVRAGRAEDLPVPDGAFDAVVASSAWHWVDPELAFPEVIRVLRPGGVLGLCWNGPDRRIPWVADLLQWSDADRRNTPRHHRSVEIPEGVPLGTPETSVFRWSRPFTPEELLGLATTYSSVITLAEEEREELLGRIRARLHEHPAIAQKGSLEVPLACLCWRSVRR